ncbi:hypothetical protein [Hydrogenophilus thiooxidans]|uniref:hypothetical protein n=1 Tax=Hydrogenophilus thiooxidans TaxID=2820326 RepID=UPI001C2195CA|nr:hypothetical protein [Hydrogenophilus thiooxidans]
MRITESTLNLAATAVENERTTFTVQQEGREIGRLTGPRRLHAPSAPRETGGRRADESTRKPQTGETPADTTRPTDVIEKEKERALTPEMRFVRELLRRFFGIAPEHTETYPLDSSHATTPSATPPAPASVASSSANEPDVIVLRAETLTATATVVRTEALAFSASGVVRTADGRTIEFAAGFTWQRSESLSVSLATTQLTAERAPKMKDPLVVDFTASEGELVDIGFRFDLMGNGTEVNLPVPISGKGFLVFDRNGNGRVDDGKELFGPATGDGFAELAALDEDSNGWIDEGDQSYHRLFVWHPFAPDRLIALRNADIGALATQAVRTRFTVDDSNGNPLGQLQKSSIYLRESGGVGTVSHLDLRV